LHGYYRVDTPSGGTHVHGLHDATTEGLGNLLVVYGVKGDKSSGKIRGRRCQGRNCRSARARR
jgi:hypothetical protein